MHALGAYVEDLVTLPFIEVGWQARVLLVRVGCRRCRLGSHTSFAYVVPPFRVCRLVHDGVSKLFSRGARYG